MISPLKTYKKNLKSRPEMKREAYAFFLEKYFKNPYNPENSVDFLPTLERFDAKNFSSFIPGKIYTFQYNPVYKDILDYYDKRPIILVCGEWIADSTGNRIVTGINFNFLPEIARVNTLEYYYQSVKGDLENGYEKTLKTDKVSFIKKALIVLQNIAQTFNVFNRAGQIGYQFAMRNYIIGSNTMKDPVLVEYEDWEWIPFVQTKDVTGASLEEIYSQYISIKNVLAKKQPPIIKGKKVRKYKN
jgi:hypothetical protein